MGLCRGQRRRSIDCDLRTGSCLGRSEHRGCRRGRDGHRRRGLSLLLAVTAVVFVGLIALSLPIVFALGIAAVVGVSIGGYPLEMVASSMIAGSQNWVLLAIPSFIFAGTVMERCGMSNALVDLARALVGWLRGGLGMSVIVVSYFFSDICGSKIGEVSALRAPLMPPLRPAAPPPPHGARLLSPGTAVRRLGPPAVLMIAV